MTQAWVDKMIRDLLGSVGTVVVGTMGLLVALRNQRRQLNAQMYIEVSRRFQELLRSFPTEAWLANTNPSRPMPPPSREVTDCTLYAIQFVADVYYLHKGGYVSANLWRLWESEIRRTLAGRVFQREWETLSTEFAHTPDFVGYLNRTQHIQARKLSRAVSSSQYFT